MAEVSYLHKTALWPSQNSPGPRVSQLEPRPAQAPSMPRFVSTRSHVASIPIPLGPAQLLARRGGNKEVRHGMRQGRPLAGFSEDGNGV